jgi:hypothetical protein
MTKKRIDTTRRHLLTAVAAAIPADARAYPGHAADPIFATIEKHKKAAAAHLDAIQVQNRIAKIRGSASANWITEKPCHDENDAFDALVGAAVTTRAGLDAKLAYLKEIAESDEWGWTLDERNGTAVLLIESFAASIAALVQVQS